MPLRLKGGNVHYKCIQRLPELLLLSRATCNRLHCVPGQGLFFVNACPALWSDWQSQRGCAVARLSRAEAASVPCVTVPAATRISESMQWHGAVRVESRWPVDTTSKKLAHLSQGLLSEIMKSRWKAFPLTFLRECKFPMSLAAACSQLLGRSMWMHESGAGKCAASTSLLLRRSSTAPQHGDP